MSDFSHMPKGDPGEEERNGDLAHALRAVIDRHVAAAGDDSGKPVCPGCVATALFNTMIAYLNDGWNVGDFLHAIFTLGVHNQDWIKEAVDNGSMAIEVLEEAAEEAVSRSIH